MHASHHASHGQPLTEWTQHTAGPREPRSRNKAGAGVGQENLSGNCRQPAGNVNNSRCCLTPVRSRRSRPGFATPPSRCVDRVSARPRGRHLRPSCIRHQRPGTVGPQVGCTHPISPLVPARSILGCVHNASDRRAGAAARHARTCRTPRPSEPGGPSHAGSLVLAQGATAAAGGGSGRQRQSARGGFASRMASRMDRCRASTHR